MKNTKKLQGINRYYHRLMQNEHHNSYYIEPADWCPISVLNQRDRFVVLRFDRDDDYIVVNNKRYYLNKFNAVKGTMNIKKRIAIVDLYELEKSKSYNFNMDYHRKYTAVFDSFDQLHKIARQQYSENGAPYFKQTADYNEDTQTCTYVFEPSFRSSTVAA